MYSERKREILIKSLDDGQKVFELYTEGLGYWEIRGKGILMQGLRSKGREAESSENTGVNSLIGVQHRNV